MNRRIIILRLTIFLAVALAGYDAAAQGATVVWLETSNQLEALTQGTRLVKTRKYAMQWNTEPSVPSIRIELWSGNHKKWQKVVVNNGTLTLKVPGNVRKGDHYTLRFFEREGETAFYISPEFTVTPRFSPIIKATAVVAAVGIAILVTGAGQSESGNGNGMPDPPKVPPQH